jgi:hypothetical protein
MRAKRIFRAIADEIKVIVRSKSKNKIHFSNREFNNQVEAEQAYERSIGRLFDVEK